MTLAFPRPFRIVVEGYLAWLRGQPCCVSPSGAGCRGSHDPHHLAGKGSRGTEPWIGGADTCAIPMCRGHHRELEDAVVAEFEAEYRINLWREASRHWWKYVATCRPEVLKLLAVGESDESERVV